MKIQIRRGMFETNSSSNHSLIITNKKNFKTECERVQKNVSGMLLILVK